MFNIGYFGSKMTEFTRRGGINVYWRTTSPSPLLFVSSKSYEGQREKGKDKIELGEEGVKIDSKFNHDNTDFSIMMTMIIFI